MRYFKATFSKESILQLCKAGKKRPNWERESQASSSLVTKKLCLIVLRMVTVMLMITIID